jgi:hypothetical protein
MIMVMLVVVGVAVVVAVIVAVMVAMFTRRMSVRRSGTGFQFRVHIISRQRLSGNEKLSTNVWKTTSVTEISTP